MRTGVRRPASGVRQQTWRVPTRRAFVGMLAAAAAVLAARPKKSREARAELPRWIGHF
ncbi:MAG: CRISPR-associated protein Cas5 [Acidobacteriota bacterium]